MVLFEHQTFEAILQRMLDQVPNDVDKREGSVIYDALAPAAMELAQMYAELDVMQRLAYADTSSGEYLEKRTAEFGVYRKKATSAIRKGIFTDRNNAPFNVPIGSRFRLNDIVYEVIEKITDGQFRMRAETAGIVGNQEFGDLLPVEPIEGLGTAILADVLIPGEDEETDSQLYKKFIESVNEKAFGGNRADYKKKITDINGVGGVKLYRTPMGGGTVEAVIIDSSFHTPSTELINNVQEIIDPLEFQGEGLGLAPIGHVVTVSGVTSVTINLETSLVLNGVTIDQVQPYVEEAIEAYLAELRKEWAEKDFLIVRINQIEARILNITGIEDISGTLLNGVASNIELSANEIPILGMVNLNG